MLSHNHGETEVELLVQHYGQEDGAVVDSSTLKEEWYDLQFHTLGFRTGHWTWKYNIN